MFQVNKTTSLHDLLLCLFTRFYIRGKQEEPLPWKIFLHVPSSDLLSTLLNKGTRYGKDFSTFPRFLTVVPDLYTETFIWTIGFKLKANQTVFLLSCPQYSVPKNLFINIQIKVNHKFLVNLRTLIFLFVETKRENPMVCRKYQFSVLVLNMNFLGALHLEILSSVVRESLPVTTESFLLAFPRLFTVVPNQKQLRSNVWSTCHPTNKLSCWICFRWCSPSKRVSSEAISMQYLTIMYANSSNSLAIFYKQ